MSSTALTEAARRNGPPLNTTIGVVLTDATLSKAQATRTCRHRPRRDGQGDPAVAHYVRRRRGVRLASGRRPLEHQYGGLLAYNALLVAAADVFTEACVDALLAARTRGPWPAYLDLVPSARP